MSACKDPYAIPLLHSLTVLLRSFIGSQLEQPIALNVLALTSLIAWNSMPEARELLGLAMPRPLLCHIMLHYAEPASLTGDAIAQVRQRPPRA